MNRKEKAIDLADTDARAVGPRRPETMVAQGYITDEAILVTIPRERTQSTFMFLWLIGWTAGCLWLLFGLINEPQWGLFCMAIPFWASWFFVAALLVWQFWGKERFLLRRQKASFERTAIVTLATREIPIAELKGFRTFCETDDEGDRKEGIEVLNAGHVIRMGEDLVDVERDWIVFQLNQFLADTDATSKSIFPATERNGDSEIEHSQAVTRLTIDHTCSVPPTDCSLQLVEDVNSFSIVQQGKLRLLDVGGVLFLNLFWNGIVSVFVVGLCGGFPMEETIEGAAWWGMLLFLTPFIAIGGFMFVALIHLIAEPFRRTTWRFEADGINRSIKWPLFSMNKSWLLRPLHHLALQRIDPHLNRKYFQLQSPSMAYRVTFELQLVTTEYEVLFSIQTLTEGEARWLANVILTQHPRWFR